MVQVPPVPRSRHPDCGGLRGPGTDYCGHGERVRFPVQASLGPNRVEPHGLALSARLHEALDHDGAKPRGREQAGVPLQGSALPLVLGGAGLHCGRRWVRHGHGNSLADSHGHAAALRRPHHRSGHLSGPRLAVLWDSHRGDDRGHALWHGPLVLPG